MTDDPRVAQYGSRLIHALLSKIENTQDEMLGVMQTVVMPRAKR